eukprot:CAMPEP_0201933802 /NCGR_PEP_ID=MMETSP0903-20130614/32338_1 /ASSEMBLY_ACC=CAM_ASM_000552 /TAXON_ID=420261 /ORGANISM="Thalassiosira antarctica, Strain CCMP982" /LENGTH=61 /DNA_ID=CAMNT_0048473833 /DNA_START=54 /DNA_END=236 /DNA_ORIENTATION=+
MSPIPFSPSPTTDSDDAKYDRIIWCGQEEQMLPYYVSHATAAADNEEANSDSEEDYYVWLE